MPTGYTDDIVDGISFQEYAMNCARAFLPALRDEPGKGEIIPEVFVPPDFYVELRDEKVAELRQLLLMTCNDWDRAAYDEYENEKRRRLSQLDDISKKRKTYEDMLTAVRKWNPPTEKHQALKQFMEEQIATSISFDCREEMYSTPIICMSGVEWFERTLTGLLHEIEYHRQEHNRAIERAEEATEWIRTLRESLAS